MTTELVILVPALQRPGHVAPFLESVIETTPVPFRVVFICDPSDFSEQRAAHAAGVDTMLYSPPPGAGAYPSKINAGIRASSEPLIFLGADDLRFRPGWWEAARVELAAGASVVGVNDLIERAARPRHSTHFLITRAYAELPTIDGSRGPMHEGYEHWFVDDEFVGVAETRGAYAYASSSHVEHLHPMVGKAPDDPVYLRGRRNSRRDRRRFRGRQALWTQPEE